MRLDNGIDALVSLRRRVGTKFRYQRPPSDRRRPALDHAMDGGLMRARADAARAILDKSDLATPASRARHRLQKRRLGPKPAHNELLHARAFASDLHSTPKSLAAERIERGSFDHVIGIDDNVRIRNASSGACS